MARDCPTCSGTGERSVPIYAEVVDAKGKHVTTTTGTTSKPCNICHGKRKVNW